MAAVVAAAASAGGSLCALLIAGQAVPRLLSCLRARYAYETNSMARSPRASTAGAGAAAAAASAAALPLQNVGGFDSVLVAIARLLAGAGRVEEALGGEDGIAAVTDKQFLLAALQACPGETTNLLTHLVWRGSRICTVTEEDEGHQNQGATAAGGGESTAEGGVFAADEDMGGGSGGAQQVGERALTTLLEIVLDARRAPHVVVAAATSTEASTPGAVDYSTCMGVLSRVLHLRDGRVQDRVEAALGRLTASGRASEASLAAAGCGGSIYLTGKLIASLFVHVPEARPVLSRMPLLLRSRRRGESAV